MIAELVVVGVLDLVEIILVQLAHKAGEVGVLEHAGQYGFCEFIHVLLNTLTRTYIHPGRRAFTTKQSPCGPQHTTFENVWSSSILHA